MWGGRDLRVCGEDYGGMIWCGFWLKVGLGVSKSVLWSMRGECKWQNSFV